MLRHLPTYEKDPYLLVGIDTSDDAGVYQLTDDIALVQSIDFFTPIVDDPYMFGQIAAANALSDIYAMGGTPKTVLNIVSFPIKKLPDEILANIMKGSADKVREANATIVGGHSIDDQEPKFGLAATGIVHPNKFWTNSGAKPGDALVLTKPLGVGIITTAIKREKATENQIKEVTAVMATLNDETAKTLSSFNPHAVTDVTGFGLLGHAFEMANSSNVSLRFHTENIPLLDGTEQLCQAGVIPGGSKANHAYLAPHIARENDVSHLMESILCDAITSGGLLISMDETEAKQYVENMHEKGYTATTIIGEVTTKKEKSLLLT